MSGEILSDVLFADTHLVKTQTQDEDLFTISV